MVIRELDAYGVALGFVSILRFAQIVSISTFTT